jgi:hypothetical protein
MTQRFLSLSREERVASLDAKQSRFLEHLARKLDALGPDPNGDTSNCFHQRRGRPPAERIARGAGRKLSGNLGLEPHGGSRRDFLLGGNVK